MGAYLQSLLDSFEQWMNKNEALDNAAELYCKKWGDDKIIRCWCVPNLWFYVKALKKVFFVCLIELKKLLDISESINS